VEIMSFSKNCILAQYCGDKDTKKCNKLCPFYIHLHGASGKGGKIFESNIPLDYSRMTVKQNPVRQSQKAVYVQVDSYVKTFPRMFKGERIRSLYLYSESPGTGKTSTACAIANEYLLIHCIGSWKRGQRPKDGVVFFLDFNAWQTKFNEFNNPRISQDTADKAARSFYHSRDAAKNAELLVIDDIGIRNPTEAFSSVAHDLINHRAIYRKPTIYTSNVPLKELMDKYDSRLYDRIKDQTVELVGFQEKSFRGVRKDWD
jgi:DNA replication protein DnaC